MKTYCNSSWSKDEIHLSRKGILGVWVVEKLWVLFFPVFVSNPPLVYIPNQQLMDLRALGWPESCLDEM